MGKLRMVNGNFYNNDYMSFEECMDLIKTLSLSQGFYGRLLRDINELEEEDRQQLKELWEKQQFRDNIDFIMYLEGGF
jgi:hypothetical protein